MNILLAPRIPTDHINLLSLSENTMLKDKNCKHSNQPGLYDNRVRCNMRIHA